MNYAYDCIDHDEIIDDIQNNFATGQDYMGIANCEGLIQALGVLGYSCNTGLNQLLKDFSKSWDDGACPDPDMEDQPLLDGVTVASFCCQECIEILDTRYTYPAQLFLPCCSCHNKE